jgi:hypothetical protein
MMSLYSVAAVGSKLREVGIFNTTLVAFDVKLARFTTGTGTQGSALTEFGHDPDNPTSLCQAFNTHTVTPTTIVDAGYRASIGAAVGAGVIWTFGDQGIRTGIATTNGIGVIIENGTGQIAQIYFVWDE